MGDNLEEKKKHVMHVDIETFSDVEIGKAGVYRYSESPLFEILLIAYAKDDEEIKIADLAQGEEFPDELFEAIFDEDTECVAHNAQFERVCFSNYLKRKYPGIYLADDEFLNPEGWVCTMVQAAENGLPLSLDGVAQVLKTGEQKDKRGKDLIRYFCVPCKPTAANGGRERNLPEDAPDRWREFKEYCLQDVATERAIYNKLSKRKLSKFERELYCFDQRVNDRGWLVDIPFVEQCIICDRLYSEEMAKQAYQLTGLENPNSVSQLKGWLEERGLEIDNLSKKKVRQAVEDLDKGGCDEEALEMLRLRQKMAKSSVKKYEACERAVCADNRARGLFMFYGANHTGRWCLAEGSPVLVKDEAGNIFEKPVEDVSVTDLVFDGENWVHHEGVVYSGDKEVITWDGITATPDHEVYIDEFTSVPLAEAKERGLSIWRGKERPTPSTE